MTTLFISDYLSDISEMLLYLLLPPDDFHNKPFRYFFRVSADISSLVFCKQNNNKNCNIVFLVLLCQRWKDAAIISEGNDPVVPSIIEYEQNQMSN